MTTTTLRPDGVVTAGDVTAYTGAANVYAATNDDSDSSYAERSAAPASQVNLGTGSTWSLDTFTLPTGAMVAWTRCRARVRAESGYTGVASISALSASGPFSYSGLYASSAATSWFDVEGAASTVLLPATQAEIDAIQLRVNLFRMELAEVFVDVNYVEKPVTAVTAVSPDPYTASNVVPIAWANTLDSDGGVQTRYWVKVFTAAQYGAGGFDPETSTPEWETEEVVGSALTTNVGPLLTGVTYRAYVKVAQTVNGASHWSDWAYDQFAVSVTTSDVDTVTAAGNSATASITVTVNRDTGSSAWDYVEVQRSTDSGTTWTDVRGATYVDATGDADTFEVIDYEVANEQSVIYRARATRLVSSLPVTGAWVSSSSASWSSTSAWLKSPLDASKNLAVIVEHPVAAQDREVAAGVFKVIGRRTPVVVSDTLTAPSSSLLIRTESDTELADMLALLGDINLLYQPLPESLLGPDQLGSQYIAVLGVTENQRVPYYSDMRLWEVSYVEIDAPADPAASAP